MHDIVQRMIQGSKSQIENINRLQYCNPMFEVVIYHYSCGYRFKLVHFEIQMLMFTISDAYCENHLCI